MITSSRQQAVSNISAGVTRSLVEFSQHPEQSEPLIGALSQTIRVALTNEELQATFRDVAIKSMRDGELQSDILNVVTGSLVKASNDENLKKVLLSSIQQGMSDALNNQEFLDAIFSSTMKVVVTGAKNTKLRDTVLNVATEAVSLAIQDKRFIQELKGVLKEVLRDGDLYRASAAGLVGAFRSKKPNDSK